MGATAVDRVLGTRTAIGQNNATTTIVERTEGGSIVDAMFAGQAAVEVGHLLGRVVTPREITALFYDRLIPEELGPVVCGRRLIRPEAVAVIVNTLRERDGARLAGEGGVDGP